MKNFKDLNINEFFKIDSEKIGMASRLSNCIHKGLNNIRSAGDEVEISVRDFFRNRLLSKYHVGTGHIIDSHQKVSQQLDIIVSDEHKNPVFCELADKTELFYYEPVYAYAEVKKSYYQEDLLDQFCNNLESFKHNMSREDVPKDAIACDVETIAIGQPMTTNPRRNMLFTFMFFVSTGSKMNYPRFREKIKLHENCYLPNMIVFLDYGVVINIDRKSYEKGEFKVNVYPETKTKENSLWVCLTSENQEQNLTISFMILQEHLNNTIVGKPNILDYTTKIFNIDINNIEVL